MKLQYFILAMLCPLLSMCQVVKNIGDTIPNVEVRGLLHYSSSKATLQEFGKKAIILDFFATWCGSCVHELPRLDQLQRKWKDELQILVVCYEPTEKITAMLERHAALRNVQLVFVTGDSLLVKLFPHSSLPHEVWMDKAGVVKAITDAASVTSAHIAKLVDGGELALTVKKDVPEFDRSRPLLMEGNGADHNKALWQQVFTGYMPGLPAVSGVVTDSLSQRRRLYLINLPILQLYERVAGAAFRNYLLNELQDSSLYMLPKEGRMDWLAQHAYCYELQAPLATHTQQLNDAAIEDLNRYLGLYGRSEKRKMPCVILYKDSSVMLNGSSGLTNIPTRKKGATHYLGKQSLTSILYLLNRPLQRGIHPTLFIDESGYTDVVALELPAAALYDVQQLERALAPYGIRIHQTEREVEVFVVGDAVAGTQ